ncbi:MAG: crosslink repair DNA glycosylase YcaQ family protein [Actinomycetota bacterium]
MWWTGVSRERASAALERVQTVALDDGYMLPAADLRDFETTGTVARGSVDLLPKWDCYTMGYAPDGRHRLVHPDVQDHLYDFRGDGRGAVLVDGVAAGVWEPRFSGRRLVIRLKLFERPAATLERVIAKRFREVAAFLGARDLSFETGQR